MTDHGKHGYLMVGVVALGAVLVLAGVVSGTAFLLWPLACMAMMAAMMAAMMWGMGGMGRGAPGPDHMHTHDDGLTHSHT